MKRILIRLLQMVLIYLHGGKKSVLTDFKLASSPPIDTRHFIHTPIISESNIWCLASRIDADCKASQCSPESVVSLLGFTEIMHDALDGLSDDLNDFISGFKTHNQRLTSIKLRWVNEPECPEDGRCGRIEIRISKEVF